MRSLLSAGSLWVFLILSSPGRTSSTHDERSLKSLISARNTPTPDEANLNIKRALAQGHRVFRRDICSDAFGPSAIRNICTPSETICCVRTNAPYPQCQNFLNKGWCCTEGDDDAERNCYVDQESSCNESGSVECSHEGTAKVCCPESTTCVSGYNFTDTFVRCEIRSTALVSLHSATLTSSSSSSSSTTSSVSTTTTASTTSTTTETTTSTTSTPTAATSSTAPESGSSGSGLSPGAIAGIAIGPALAIILAVALWFLWRRRQKKKLLQPYQPQSSVEAKPQQPGVGYYAPHTASPPTDSGAYKYHHEANAPGHELSNHQRHELPDQPRHELESSGAHRIS